MQKKFGVDPCKLAEKASKQGLTKLSLRSAGADGRLGPRAQGVTALDVYLPRESSANPTWAATAADTFHSEPGKRTIAAENRQVPRDVRQSLNRDVFRAVNKEIEDLASRLGIDAQSFVCECARLGCTEQITVPLAVYARVRDTPAAYLVHEGHEDPSSESVVFGHADYRIVVLNDS